MTVSFKKNIIFVKNKSQIYTRQKQTYDKLTKN